MTYFIIHTTFRSSQKLYDEPGSLPGGVLLDCKEREDATPFETEEEARAAIDRTIRWASSRHNWQWSSESYQIVTEEEHEFLALPLAKQRQLKRRE